jgi:hypothetical protein
MMLISSLAWTTIQAYLLQNHLDNERSGFYKVGMS